AIASGILVLIGMLRSNPDAGMDRLLPADHCPDQCYGISFPDTRIHAGDRYRHSLAGPAGTRVVRALQQASLRRLAMGLRDDCRRLAVSQCVGADYAVIPENSGPPAAGADPIRAAIPDCPGGRFVRLCRTWHSRGHQVSSSRDYRQLAEIRPGPTKWLSQNGRSRRKRLLQPFGETAEPSRR